MSSTGNYFQRVAAVYLINDTAGTVHVRSKTFSLLVPIFAEKHLKEAHLITEAKRIIAADQDVSEKHICVVGVGPI